MIMKNIIAFFTILLIFIGITSCDLIPSGPYIPEEYYYFCVAPQIPEATLQPLSDLQEVKQSDNGCFSFKQTDCWSGLCDKYEQSIYTQGDYSDTLTIVFMDTIEWDPNNWRIGLYLNGVMIERDYRECYKVTEAIWNHQQQ